MTSLVVNLLSGLIGALIGAFISFYIYQQSRVAAARHRLLVLVSELGWKSWWEPETGKPAVIFHENYTGLWGAYSELRGCLLLPWNRKKLDKAWQRYMHIEYCDDMPDEEVGKVFMKGTFGSRDEAVKLSSEFVSFLKRMW